MPKKSTRKGGNRGKSMTKKPRRDRMMISDDEEKMEPKPKPTRKKNKVTWGDNEEKGSTQKYKSEGKKMTTAADVDDEEIKEQSMKNPTRKSDNKMKKPTRKRDSRGRFASSS